MKGLEILLLNDQPVTCPQCSSRTDFYEFVHEGEEYQIHFCRYWDCGIAFLTMQDDEADENWENGIDVNERS